jgi:hypothetical protein
LGIGGMILTRLSGIILGVWKNLLIKLKRKRKRKRDRQWFMPKKIKNKNQPKPIQPNNKTNKTSQ